MKSNLFHLLAWAVLVLGVAIEASIMEKPTEETVAEFEAAEYPSVHVLDHAIEDQRAVVDHLTAKYDRVHGEWFGNEKNEKKKIEPRLRRAAEMQFRSVRVLGLLTEIREKEVTA